jgi:hypothetical protein
MMPDSCDEATYETKYYVKFNTIEDKTEFLLRWA